MTRDNAAMNRLYEAMLRLKTAEECEKFLDDLCTVRELQDISQRLEVAAMLRAGKNYQTISRETGASTATICRVGKCLNYGPGGYSMVLERMEDGE